MIRFHNHKAPIANEVVYSKSPDIVECIAHSVTSEECAELRRRSAFSSVVKRVYYKS